MPICLENLCTFSELTIVVVLSLLLNREVSFSKPRIEDDIKHLECDSSVFPFSPPLQIDLLDEADFDRMLEFVDIIYLICLLRLKLAPISSCE